MPETLTERQLRLSAATTQAMDILARFASGEKPEAQGLSPLERLELQKVRGKFAGIFTRMSFTADERGRGLQAADFVTGAVSSYRLAKAADLSAQEPLYELAHYWTRKIPGTNTLVPLELGALADPEAMTAGTAALYHLCNPGLQAREAPARAVPDVGMV